MSVCLLILTLLVTVNVAVKVPKNFRGSPEIFSGYLPNSDKFVQSFTYTRGLEIVGNSTQVEKILAESNPQGEFLQGVIKRGGERKQARGSMYLTTNKSQ